MIVALDVGNTKMSLGIVRGGDVTAARRAATRPTATADELERTLDEMLKLDGAALGKVDVMVLASVVPPVSDAVAHVCRRNEIKLLTATSATVPMPVRLDQPDTVGRDRLIEAFAADRLYGAPLIVVSLGTATTFNVVDAGGAFIGGAIAPGLALGLEALAEKTAQLPHVPLDMPRQAIGRDTESAMQSGALIGHRGLVRELIDAISAEMSADGAPPPKVILTGGLSNTDWARTIAGVDAVDPLLTLRGLALLEREVAARPKMAHAKA